jgi:hypothetical protein
MKNLALLKFDAERKEIDKALLQLPPRLVGKIADLIDPENTIRRLQKIKNLAFLNTREDAELITGYNIVAGVRNTRFAKLKEAFSMLLVVVQLFKGVKTPFDAKEKIISILKGL